MESRCSLISGGLMKEAVSTVSGAILAIGFCSLVYSQSIRTRDIQSPRIVEDIPAVTRLIAWQRSPNGTCRTRRVLCERRWTTMPDAVEDVCCPFVSEHAIQATIPRPARLMYERERIGSEWQFAPVPYDVPIDSEEGAAIWALPVCATATR